MANNIPVFPSTTISLLDALSETSQSTPIVRAVPTVDQARSTPGVIGMHLRIGGYYADGDGGGGPDRYYASGGPYTDNGGSVIVIGGTVGSTGPNAWLGNTSVPWSPRQFGCKGSGNDDTTAMQALFDSGLDILADGDTYTVSPLTLSSTLHRSIDFAGGGLTTGSINLLELDGCQNVSFYGTIFDCSKTQSTEDFLGVVWLQDTDVHDIVFNQCSFSASNANTNGIKFVSESTYDINNIEFRNCRFGDIGRMGIEIQNHVADTTYRYSNIRVIDCLFDGTGISNTYGQAISLSGYGHGCEIRSNTIGECLTVGIELVGATNTAVLHNRFTPAGTKVSTYAYHLISCSNTRPMSKLQIIGNYTDSGATSATDTYVGIDCFFQNINNSIIEGNNFWVHDGIKFDTMTKCLVSGNTFKGVGGSSPVVIQNVSVGNKFIENVVDGSPMSGSYPCVTFDGSGTTHNVFEKTSMLPGSAGTYFVNTNSAIANYAYESRRLDTGERIYAYVQFSMSDADYTIVDKEYGIALPDTIKILGTNTATRVLTLPAVNHDFAIYNTSGQTVTLKNGSTTGDDIANTRKAVAHFMDNYNFVVWLAATS